MSWFGNRNSPDQSSVEKAFAGHFDEIAFLHAYRQLDLVNRIDALRKILALAQSSVRKPWENSYENSTTQADVAEFFRLILGRLPSEREWALHAATEIGQDVSVNVRTYLASLEFELRGLLRPLKRESIALASIEGFSIYARLDDAATGMHIHAGAYEPEVTSVFRHHLTPGMNVVDIGANVGYFTMLSASIVGAGGMVTAIEANPENAKLIEASRRVNGFTQVRVANVAVGRELGLLHTDGSSNGVTHAITDDEALFAARTVACLPLERLIPQNRKLDFIKIDIEGSEYLALQGAEERLRRDRPVIVTEFTPDIIPGISGVDAETYLRFLVGCGLGLGVIRKDGGLDDFANDTAAVMRAWEATGRAHVDLVASPTGATR